MVWCTLLSCFCIVCMCNVFITNPGACPFSPEAYNILWKNKRVQVRRRVCSQWLIYLPPSYLLPDPWFSSFSAIECEWYILLYIKKTNRQALYSRFFHGVALQRWCVTVTLNLCNFLDWIYLTVKRWVLDKVLHVRILSLHVHLFLPCHFLSYICKLCHHQRTPIYTELIWHNVHLNKCMWNEFQMKLLSFFGFQGLYFNFVCFLAEDACWWNDRIIQVEETKAFSSSLSSHGAQPLRTDRPGPAQHSQQQPLW